MKFMRREMPAGGKGRPKLLINEDGKRMIETLAGLFCTDEEIATVLETTVDTLTNKNNKQVFSEYKKRGIDKGKTSLRRLQFKHAEKSASMAIFLGKQYLGQSDKVENITAQVEKDPLSIAFEELEK